MNELRIRNWDKWQTYRNDRGQPPWIKVHRRLLRDPNFVALTDAQRGQLLVMWILAADRGGAIPASPAMLRKLCYMDDEPDLQVFIAHGFIEPDANATPERRQDDRPEAEAETEADTETTAPASPTRIVENSGIETDPAYTLGELKALAYDTLGLGRLDNRDQAKNHRILTDWLYQSNPRDPVEIACAIEGAAQMRDLDLIGWDSARPGIPMTLAALVKSATLADQGDGRAVRPLYDVAVEYRRVRDHDPRTAAPRTKGSPMQRLHVDTRRAG